MTAPAFIFFGGKGGVGKTTCAAARAVVEARRGADVLVVSTDPAHSLGDALAVRLSGAVSRVAVGRSRALRAVELDAAGALARWMREHRRALGDVIEHGTWLDRDDIAALLDLAVPGVDELVAMLEIVRLAAEPVEAAAGTRAAAHRRSPQRRLVIVDTAPTGHTLRLLAAPDALAAITRLLDALQERHRTIRREFGSGGPEAADALLALMARQAAATAALLRDPTRSAFAWVTLPERLALAETADALAALRREGIAVRELVVNRVLPDGPPCALCDGRRVEERRVVAALRRSVRLPGRLVPAETVEPRGVSALARLGLALVGRITRSPALTPRRRPRRMTPADRRGRDVARAHVARWSKARVIFFAGKGGVGKTTCAAAVALRLAREQPTRPVLLLSTDPAHSLGDVLRVPAGDEPSSVSGVPNLVVRELDAAAAFAARRASIASAVADISLSLGAAAVAGDGAAAGGLLDLAPPGVDELFGVLTVVDERRAFPLIVVDTAPTGHTLRLLELPDAAREWVQLLMRVLLKYRAVVKATGLAEELVELSRSIRDFQAMLHDAAAARFLVVARAAELPRLETARLLRRLDKMRLVAPAVIVNAVTPTNDACPRCRAVRAAERRAVAALARRRRCAIIEAPLVAPPPMGSAALDRWAALWTA